MGDPLAVFAAADAGLCKSGTTTLEAALADVPMVIAYRLNPVSFAIAIRMLQVPHVGLVNLIAGREVSPELLQGAVTPAALADAVLRCSTPTARPPVASGTDWGSCASGWGRRARPTGGRPRPGAGGVKLGRAEPLVTALLAGLVRLLAATWRYRVQGWEHVVAARASGRPVIYILWHSRILPLLYHRRDESVALLISRHRDGGYLAELSERWGYRVVRGLRGVGEAGLLGLVRYLREGGEVALTPEPRGPAERMKPGALAAAQHANAVVIAAGARASSAWWIESWDRFCLPQPFARVDVGTVCRSAWKRGRRRCVAR